MATQFPHARELLSGGAGVLVPHQDPTAIAEALRAMIVAPAALDAMGRAATAAAPGLLWPAIGAEYRALVAQLMSARVAA